MRVLVAMSGGVDSSVAAALLVERSAPTRWSGPPSSCGAAHRTRAVARWPTWRMPGGWPSSSGWSITSSTSQPSSRSGWWIPTCRVTPRAARRTRASSATAISSSTGCSSGPGPWASTPWPPGTTPGRADRPDGRFRLCRGADPLKDQSYVLAMLGQAQLARLCFPVGEMTKAEVREPRPPASGCARRPSRQPGRLLHPLGRGPPGLPRRRLPLHPGALVDHRTGEDLGPVDAVELVTVGQRRGWATAATAPGGS